MVVMSVVMKYSGGEVSSVHVLIPVVSQVEVVLMWCCDGAVVSSFNKKVLRAESLSFYIPFIHNKKIHTTTKEKHTHVTC